MYELLMNKKNEVSCSKLYVEYVLYVENFKRIKQLKIQNYGSNHYSSYSSRILP